MFVNGEEINLYNFKYNNEEDYYDIKGKSITKSLMKMNSNKRGTFILCFWYEKASYIRI